jgi:hypothetical protein
MSHRIDTYGVVVMLKPANRETESSHSMECVIIDGGLDWMLDLLSAFTHNLEQVIIALLLISTLYKSPQH